MASNTSEDPLRHHPHGVDQHFLYGHRIKVIPDPLGGPPTVSRERPLTLNWDKLTPTARNMFAELATGDYTNRFETCVHLTLLKWAEQMKPGDPNLLPDGNPTYIQDDVIPVIKAYANRIPEPGVAGTPIPPALPMIELEALDFLHHHQVLPYQQADYAEIFADFPDGFVWHPIQTLVGIRGLDHRTLVEFRAYKHFWAIHRDDPDTKEHSTKDEPTSEVSIIRPRGDPDYPQVAPGGFHNMSLPPTNQQLRKELAKINKTRKCNGEPIHPQMMYVRFANNLAHIITDHSNDTSVFDGDGVPRPRTIGSLPYDKYIDEDDFISRFAEFGRVYLSRLPTLVETNGPPAAPAAPTTQPKEQTPTLAPASTNTPAASDNTQSKAHPKVIELTAEFAGTGLEARIDIPSCECPPTIKAAQMTGAFASGIALTKKSFTGGPQRVHIPEVECCSKATVKTSTPTPTPTTTNPAPSAPPKLQLDLANLSAIETKIKQLSLEKKNPRQLKPLSKSLGNAYSFDYSGAAAKAVASRIATTASAKATASKGNGAAKANTPVAPIPTIVFHPPSVNDMLPALRLMDAAQGYYFANSENRQKLVDDLANEGFCDEIPRSGPGCKSWLTLKGEQRTNPIKFRGVDGPSIEHIKYAAVVSIQQTVFYYLYTGERIKRKNITTDSPDGTCFVKVYNILEAGQRLVVEHDIENYYVRTNGVARVWDHSMNSGKIPTPKETITGKLSLTTEEQAAYRHLVADSKELWKHPTTCKCKSGKS
ncbi:uncharacterized protein DFL_002005 [Arthrobotrys flagrans]|uniref:Uncharacterized protein n=1 Tax=Arthrobotrys flagrans TaxID=97331 RepID=A0A437A996_ARTFL|nr:hypothetical protein DFL_002005 [Arthrobotrys flagrans]